MCCFFVFLFYIFFFLTLFVWHLEFRLNSLHGPLYLSVFPVRGALQRRHVTRGSEAPYFGRAFMPMEVLCTLTLCSLFTLTLSSTWNILYGLYDARLQLVSLLVAWAIGTGVHSHGPFWILDVRQTRFSFLISLSVIPLPLLLLSFFTWFPSSSLFFNASFEFEDSGTLLGRMAVWPFLFHKQVLCQSIQPCSVW